MRTNLNGAMIPFNCWIDPDGGIHEVELWGHTQFAIDTLRSKYDIEPRHVEESTARLRELGWSTIATRSEHSYAEIRTIPRPTPAIYQAIFDAYTACGQDEIWAWLISEGYDVKAAANRVLQGEELPT